MFAWLKPSGRSVGATVAAVALAGSLSVGMVAMEARPAEALVPMLVVPILGPIAAAMGVSVSGLATAAVSTAGAGIALAISQPGAFDWLKDVPNFFTPPAPVPATNADGQKNRKYEGEYVPVPSRGTAGGPLMYDRVWGTDIARVGEIGIGGNMVWWDYHNTVNDGGSALNRVRGSAWIEMRCKYLPDPAVRHRDGELLIHQGVAQSTGDAKATSFIQVGCKEIMPDLNNTDWVPVEASASPPTTAQKATKHDPAGISWDEYRWAPGKTTWRADDYAPQLPQYRVEVACVAADGTRAVLSANTDLNPDGRVNVPSCKAAGLGDVAESMVVGFADGDKIKQPIFTSTPAYADQFADCDPVFGKVCKVEIFIDGKPCAIGAPACVSWPGLSRVNPARVKCMYGGRELDLSACGAMEGAYVYGGTPGVKENTDGNPDTWRDPRGIPGWVPHEWFETGPRPAPDPAAVPLQTPDPAPAPDVSFDPAPDPGTDPGTDPAPDPGTDPGVQPAPGGFPATGASPADNCVSPAWSWNPVDWVKNPVVCALQDAFVPKMDVQGRIVELQGMTLARPPLNWISTPMAGPGGGGCPNWVVSIPGGTAQNVVCNSSFTAAVVGARGPLFGLVATAMVWPLLRSVWYAAIPILRVTPSGGSK